MTPGLDEAWFCGQVVDAAQSPEEAWRLLGAEADEARRFAASALIGGIGRTVGIGAKRLTAAGSDELRWIPVDLAGVDFCTVGPDGEGRWLAVWCDGVDRVADEATADALCAKRAESTGRRWVTVRRTLALRH
jgi:hypothetical protein